MNESLKKTALNEIHREFGARMVDFAGWDMPVQYDGALKEHLAVRTAAGVFDVSHMGELEITGRDALALVQKVTCNDASKLSDGQAQYSAFLYPKGTFVDDVVVYRMQAQHFLICVNASNREKDFRWLEQHREGEVEVRDNSDSYVQLAVQGPAAEKVLQQLTAVDLHAIRFYRFERGSVCGVDTLISRTGYTGEDGFELYFPPQHAEHVWREIFRVGEPEGIKAAGLAARNTLRLEMKYALYGNDIDSEHTPLEAGLGWIVKLAQGDFIGRQALVEQKAAGLPSKLMGFQMTGRGIARDHFPVYGDGRLLGEVSSGSFCPSAELAVGLTYLPTELARIGQSLEIDIRGKRVAAEVVKTPFLSK